MYRTSSVTHVPARTREVMDQEGRDQEALSRGAPRSFALEPRPRAGTSVSPD